MLLKRKLKQYLDENLKETPLKFGGGLSKQSPIFMEDSYIGSSNINNYINENKVGCGFYSW